MKCVTEYCYLQCSMNKYGGQRGSGPRWMNISEKWVGIIGGVQDGIQGVSKKMPDSEIWLLGAYRDCLLLTMILGTFV